MADHRDSLPDISGVFNIDESKIPKGIIAKPEEKKETPPEDSILLRPENRAEEKKLVKERKIRAKEKKKIARKKEIKRVAIIAGLAAVLLLALVLGVRAAILNSKQPTVAVAQVTKTTLTAHYDSEATIIAEEGKAPAAAPAPAANDDADDEEDEAEDGEEPAEAPAQQPAAAVQHYAVFVENDYDVYGLQKGQRATVTVGDGVQLTGVVSDIRKEDSESGLIQTLMGLLTGSTFSTASNYTVFVALDENYAAEDDAPVKVSVVTGIAEEVLAVPAGAVEKEEGQHYVWVYKNFGKKLKRQDVTVGLESDGLIEIQSGLAEGDFVVKDVLGENTELYNNVKVKLSTDQ